MRKRRKAVHLRGWYNGVRFNTSYEYFFLKWLECERGIDVATGVERADTTDRFSVSYGQPVRVVKPDFYVPMLATAFDVANSRLVIPDLAARHAAFRKHLDPLSIVYRVIDERTFSVPKNPRRAIVEDQGVFLVNSRADPWSSMFVEQCKFMRLLESARSFHHHPVDVTSKAGQKVLKEAAHECMHELFEAIHLLRNSKPHRSTDVSNFDREGFLEELADALHYLIEVFIFAGLTPSDVHDAFMRKSTVNFCRIRNGY